MRVTTDLKGNDMSKENNAGGGIGVLGLLGVCFVVLKLMGYIAWSWWLVTLPFWGGIALILAACAVYLIFAVIVALLK